MRTIAIITVLLIVAMLPVSAATITQTQNIEGTPDLTETLTFNKFNEAGATLNSINIRLNLGISGGSLGADNDSSEDGYITFTLGATGSLSGVGVHLLDGSFNPIASNLQVTTGTDPLIPIHLLGDNGDGSVIDTSGPDGATFTGDDNDSSTNGNVSSSFFAEYSGPGTYGILVDISQFQKIEGISGLQGTFSPVTSDSDVIVTYDYTPVPEPSGMIAMLAGLTGLAGVVARRRK